MAQFSYKARRRSGELVEGLLEVTDRPAALAQIQRLGLFPLAVDTAKAGAMAAAAAEAGKKGKAVDLMAFLPPSVQAQLRKKRKPKLQELATYTQQLANLLNCGMPLTVALTEQAGNLVLGWSGGVPPYQVQFTGKLVNGGWQNLGNSMTQTNLVLAPTNAEVLYRIQGQ